VLLLKLNVFKCYTYQGDSEDLDDCFPPPPPSFQSDDQHEIEELKPPIPPQQFGKVSPSLLPSFQPVRSCPTIVQNLHKRKTSIFLNQKQYSKIERNIASNCVHLNHFSMTSYLKTSKCRIQMTSPLTASVTPRIKETDSMQVRFPVETDIDIEEFLQTDSLDLDIIQKTFELSVSPHRISDNLTPLPIPDIFEMCQESLVPSQFKSLLDYTENAETMTPLPPTPPPFSPIIPNLQLLPFPKMPETSFIVTKDPKDSLHAQKQCLTTSFSGEPLAPIINQSTNQKQRNLRVSFSNEVKRSIIENLDDNIDNFDAGELLQELDKLTSKLVLRKLLVYFSSFSPMLLLLKGHGL
jgi:hypothetical protein